MRIVQTPVRWAQIGQRPKSHSESALASNCGQRKTPAGAVPSRAPAVVPSVVRWSRTRSWRPTRSGASGAATAESRRTRTWAPAAELSPWNLSSATVNPGRPLPCQPASAWYPRANLGRPTRQIPRPTRRIPRPTRRNPKPTPPRVLCAGTRAGRRRAGRARSNRQSSGQPKSRYGDHGQRSASSPPRARPTQAGMTRLQKLRIDKRRSDWDTPPGESCRSIMLLQEPE